MRPNRAVVSSLKFWGFVGPPDANGCWPWLGKTLAGGYGIVGFLGKTKTAPRVSYIIHHGYCSLTPEQIVCHACDNKLCVNPEHLWLGSQMDNIHDCIRKGRDKHGMKPGSQHPSAKLTETIVRQLREEFSTGLYTKSALGRKYGISQGHARNIINGLKWRHC